MVADAAHHARAAALFEEAADRVAAEARRLDDIADDVRREVRDLHWTGHNADYFRKHAAYQAVRAGENREVVESLRVLLLRAAADSRAAAAATPTHHPAKPPHHHTTSHSRGGVSGGGEG
jgi:hypothetical protein